MKKRKLLEKALSSPGNLRFSEALVLAESFGFRLARTIGSHHILTHDDIPEMLNLQEVGGKAKA
jgi:predicted RNA binding protein YcfA (HicA-like mRNA interferase family)